MSDMKLRKWDVTEHWETDKDMLLYLQVVLEDGMPELIAAALVAIARAKGLLATTGEAPRGESCLEKAIEGAYRLYSDATPELPALPASVPEGAN